MPGLQRSREDDFVKAIFFGIPKPKSQNRSETTAETGAPLLLGRTCPHRAQKSCSASGSWAGVGVHPLGSY